jgi:hypothetical protein
VDGACRREHPLRRQPQRSIFQDTFNSREGPIQIIQHRQFHTDADGNATVVRTFEKIGDC